MKKRRLGRTGLEVSVLGFGGAEIGLQDIGPAEASHVLGAALDAGINVIDTAECYKNSEEMIGQALGGRKNDVFIFTKCGHAVAPDEVNWDPKTLTAGLERSLKRLGRDHLDLVQLHSCPLELLQRGDVIDILERARDAGKIRFIGLSADGNAAAFGIRTGRFDVLQTSFSIADQDALDRTFPLARERDMGVIVKRPIANAVWKYKEKPADPWLHRYWDRIRELDYGFLSEAEAFSIALRFVLTPPEATTAIVGTTNPRHLATNAQALAQDTLDKETFDTIRNRFIKCSNGEWPGVG